MNSDRQDMQIYMQIYGDDKVIWIDKQVKEKYLNVFMNKLVSMHEFKQ